MDKETREREKKMDLKEVDSLIHHLRFAKVDMKNGKKSSANSHITTVVEALEGLKKELK